MDEQLTEQPPAKLRRIGVTLMIVGVLFLVGGVMWDLNGGPSWLHVLTWVGGGVFAYGLVTTITAGRSTLRP
ncbi:hypothetical protein ACF1AJ_16870 [Leifsonia sp. NPDC014704]|uniref:hypothetical protein n=1 Tax=Leifsonia sp. NPDC014704 TaxID=3364123 RepID=UPI0036F47A3C